MQQEMWRDIKGYEGMYQVSNLGRVKSLKRNHGNNINTLERMRKGDIGDTGYYRIRLWNHSESQRLSIHRLVAASFLPNPENKAQVNHKDGNKLNNHVENLEWVTPKENAQHALRTGLYKNVSHHLIHAKKGKDNIRARSVIQFDQGFYPIKVWDTLTEAERELGFWPGSLNRVLSRKSSFYKDSYWRYNDR